MKLSEYLSQIQTLVSEHPESLDYDVVYASDDEGNQFHPVGFGPSLGKMEYGDFSLAPPDGLEAMNAVCIN